jgi:type IV conjugative transfer system protein TraE
MLKNFSNKKNDIIMFQRNVLFVAFVVSFLMSFLLLLLLLGKDTNTILVPSSMSNSISISTKKPHNTYLEAFTRDVMYTMLNLTPNNIDYAEKSILSFSHGSAYGILKTQIENIKNNIMSKKFSTAFYPTSIYPNEQDLSVIVDGTLYTYLGQKEVSSEKKRYEIKYDYTSSRLTILGFTELDSDEVLK